jgi:hypothetical protein
MLATSTHIDPCTRTPRSIRLIPAIMPPYALICPVSRSVTCAAVARWRSFLSGKSQEVRVLPAVFAFYLYSYRPPCDASFCILMYIAVCWAHVCLPSKVARAMLVQCQDCTVLAARTAHPAHTPNTAASIVLAAHTMHTLAHYAHTPDTAASAVAYSS